MDYYKSRKEAEEVRTKGELIYFVANKGYYIVPSKNKTKFKMCWKSFNCGLITMGFIVIILTIIL